MKLLNLLTISLLAIGLSACSTFEQHASGLVSKNDRAYVNAQSTPGLKVPPGLSSANVGNQFAIPPVTGTGAIPASPVPPGGLQVPAGYKPPVATSNKHYF